MTYTVQRLNLDLEVVREYKTESREAAEEKAEFLFLAGHPSKVLDDKKNVICEFEC